MSPLTTKLHTINSILNSRNAYVTSKLRPMTSKCADINWTLRPVESLKRSLGYERMLETV